MQKQTMATLGFLSAMMRCPTTWWYIRCNDLMGLLYTTDEKVLFLERKYKNLQDENQILKERLSGMSKTQIESKTPRQRQFKPP
jgi:hypothetical protein